MLTKFTFQLRFTVSILSGRSVNHYEILGVARDANESEIKKKFYEMAKVYHPDVCKQQGAAIKFAKISTAYQILSNRQKRKNYDTQNRFKPNEQSKKYTNQQYNARYKSQKRYATKNQGQDYQDFTAYDSYFKKNRKFSKPRRGTDININFSISFQQSIKGVSKQVTFTQYQICNSCSHQEYPICFTCGGKGNIYNRTKRQKEKCSKCDGRGYRNDCKQCLGKSFQQKQVCHDVYFQRNTHNRTILRLQGLGHHGFKSTNGDLYITVYVQPSKIYRVDGNNIYSQHQIEYLTAILGGKSIAKTIHGEEQIDIEAGTQSGFNKSIFEKKRGSYFYSKDKDSQQSNKSPKIADVIANGIKKLIFVQTVPLNQNIILVYQNRLDKHMRKKFNTIHKSLQKQGAIINLGNKHKRSKSYAFQDNSNSDRLKQKCDLKNIVKNNLKVVPISPRNHHLKLNEVSHKIKSITSKDNYTMVQDIQNIPINTQMIFQPSQNSPIISLYKLRQQKDLRINLYSMKDHRKKLKL